MGTQSETIISLQAILHATVTKLLRILRCANFRFGWAIRAGRLSSVESQPRLDKG